MNAQITSVDYTAKRWKLLLCAFLLIVSPLLFHLHAIEHFSDGEGEACEICFAGAGLQHGIMDSAPAAQISSPNSTLLASYYFLSVSFPFFSFQQRAPPLNSPVI